MTDTFAQITDSLNAINRHLSGGELSTYFLNINKKALVSDNSIWQSKEAYTTLTESHVYYEIALQLNNGNWIEIENKTYHTEKNHFVLIKKGERHKIAWRGGIDKISDVLWISIMEDCIRVSFSEYLSSERKKLWYSDINIPIISLVKEIDDELQSGKFSVEAVSQYFVTIFTLVLRHLSYEDFNTGVSWAKVMISNVKAYINGNITGKISLQELSDAVSISPNYLCKLFRQNTGETIVAYIKRKKIDKSLDYLKDSSLSLSKVAEKCGFCDQFYYSKVFKSIMSVSPNEYRKNLIESSKNS